MMICDRCEARNYKARLTLVNVDRPGDNNTENNLDVSQELCETCVWKLRNLIVEFLRPVPQPKQGA